LTVSQIFASLRADGFPAHVFYPAHGFAWARVRIILWR